MKKRIKQSCGIATVLGLVAAIQGINAQAATCNYSISNEWNTGYTGAITIKNTGTSPIYSWGVTWQFTTNRITSSWNAEVTGSNPYLAESLNWNGTIQPGQEVQFGMQVDKNGGEAETPLISGTVCDYGHESSSDASSLPATSSSSAPASSSSSSVMSSAPAISSSSASSISSPPTSNQQCNWYGTLYPLCASTQSGWGWEDSHSCIALSTCISQPAPYGVVGGSNSSSSATSSSSIASSISSASSSSVPASSSSSSVASSITSSISSSSSSQPASSSSSAPSSSSSSSISSSTPAGVLFSDDFEGDSDGAQPADWDNFIGWIGNGPNPNGTAYALVETGRAVSGSKAVHFSGGQSPAMITRALPAGTNTLYVSAWVYMTRQLGMNPGDNHETLIALRGSAGNANNEVRFGEIKGVIGTNEVPSDNIAPTMANWGNGPAFASDTWHCIEVGFLSEPAYDEVHAWINGTEVHSITHASDWNNGALAADWLNGKFNEIAFGWHSFSQNEVDVWMDDIVVSTSRIGGCPQEP